MIVFVVVIYNIRLAECRTLASLRASLAEAGLDAYRILVLDNSPAPLAPDAGHAGLDYVAFNANVGLARAYKHGLGYSREHGAAFMVTLDQDSTVTPAYIGALAAHEQRYRGQEVALCPQIFCGERQVSPYSFSALGSPRYGSAGKLHAINSFSAYSVSGLARAGIIDEFYWLDALDFSIFENLHRSGIPVVPMAVEVQHSLSLLEGRVQHGRLANIALYEAVFLFEYCAPLRALAGSARLLVRVARHTDFTKPGNGFGALFMAIASGARQGLARRLQRRPALEAQV